MRQLIARAGQRPTAVLITNDFAALGAMEALAVAQILVPDDISIVGYDNFGQGSTSLTTIRSDLMEVGRIAARTLLQWIETGRAPNQRTTVPVETDRACLDCGACRYRRSGFCRYRGSRLRINCSATESLGAGPADRWDAGRAGMEASSVAAC